MLLSNSAEFRPSGFRFMQKLPSIYKVVESSREGSLLVEGDYLASKSSKKKIYEILPHTCKWLSVQSCPVSEVYRYAVPPAPSLLWSRKTDLRRLCVVEFGIKWKLLTWYFVSVCSSVAHALALEGKILACSM